MIPEIYMYLAEQAETNVGLPVYKGYPYWAGNTTKVVPPILALESRTTGAGPNARLGQAQARWQMTFWFWLFARNEPEMNMLLEKLIVWLKGLGAFEINGQRVGVSFQMDGQRHPNDSGTQQEAYAFFMPLTVTW